MSYNRQVGTFLRTHKGQNKRALEMILLGVEHMLAHNKEWTGVARLVTGVEPRMGKMQLRVIGEVLGGISKVSDPKQPTGIRFKFGDNFGPTEKLEELRKLVADGESIYGQAVQKFVGMDTDAKPEFDAEKRFKALATAALNAGMGLDEALQHMRSAFNKAEITATEKAVSQPVAELETF